MESAPQPGAGRFIRGLLLFSFIVVLFFSYSNTFTSPPYLDDFHSFVFDRSIYINDISLSSILSLTKTQFGITRFLPMLTLALNHNLGESNLIYFHLVNLLIHVLSFLAAYFLINQIIAVEKKRNPDSFLANMAGWLPICVAALWALSPVQTSAVTYLVQRMASMLGLFYFLSVGLYIKFRLCQTGSTRKRAALIACFILASLGAFLSKENSALLPFSIALVEIWFFESVLLWKAWGFFRRRSWKKWVLIGIVGSACLAIGIDVFRTSILAGYSHRYFTLGERVLTEGRIVIWYISLLFWPDPSRLSMEHYTELSTSLLNPPSTLFCFMLIVGFLAGSIYSRKKYPVITFGIIWFFLNLSLESTIIPLELIFEHRLYVPSLGMFLSMVAVLALVLRYLFGRLPESEFGKVFCSILIILACCSALLTFTRNDDWKDIVSIQYDNVTKAPQLPRTNSNYANALIGIGEYDEAIKYAEKALELNKPGRESYAVAANAIAISLVKTGRYEEAITRGKELLANYQMGWDADSIPFLCLTIAQAHMFLNQPKEAYHQIQDSFVRTSRLDRTDNSFHKKESSCFLLRKLLAQIQDKDIDLNGDGKPDPGEKPIDFWIATELRGLLEFDFSRMLIEKEFARNPENVEVAQAMRDLRKNDALNQAQKERWNFEEKYVHRAFSSKFNFCMAVAFLVQEKHMKGFFQQIGENCLNAALEIAPKSPDALLLKGWYAYAGKNTGEAVLAAKQAISIDPENAKAWLGLGFFQLSAGSANEAREAFNKVLEIYPGYSKRPVILGICQQIEKGLPVDPVSENRDNSSMNAQIEAAPSS